MNKIFKKMSTVRALVIGDIILDCYKWGSVSRISPEAPVPVVNVKEKDKKLGGAGNAAQSMATLGASITIFGRLGADSRGDQVRELMDEQGIDSSLLMIQEDFPTTVKTRIIAQNQHLVRLDRENTDTLRSDDLQSNHESIDEVLESYDVALISDYGKGVLSKDTLNWWRNQLRKHGVPTVIDPYTEHFPLYEGSSLITPNEKELREGMGDSGPGDSTISDLAEECIETMNVSAVLVTRGEEGMTLFENNREPHKIGTNAREVYDVTGAGDTVAALMTLGEALDIDRRETMNLANAAAGAVVERMGTAAVSVDQIKNVLNR